MYMKLRIDSFRIKLSSLGQIWSPNWELLEEEDGNQLLMHINEH